MKYSRLSGAVCASIFLLCISTTHASIIVPTGLVAGDTFHIIFVSSTVRDPTSSDITDYDAHVQAAANDAEIGNTIGGNTIELNGWRALGSTLTVDAVDHLAPLFSSTTNVPIYNQNGQMVSASFDGLWDGSLDVAVTYDEKGVFKNTSVWTGSNLDGTRYISTPPLPDRHYLGASVLIVAGTSTSSSSSWISATSQAPDVVPSLSLYSVSQELLITSSGDVVLAAVPLPAAVWLFGSGLLGLVGMARRKKAA